MRSRQEDVPYIYYKVASRKRIVSRRKEIPRNRKVSGVFCCFIGNCVL